jgi:hypothetical protein
MVVLQRAIVLAQPCRTVALRSMVEGLLGRDHVVRIAMPYLQGRFLDGSTVRKRQRPRKSRLESDLHGIEMGRGKFPGLSAR